MRYVLLSVLLLAGCASTPAQPPQIQRISPEELERILPKPVPNLPLEEVVRLSQSGESADAIINNIRASNSRYELTPSQAIELHRQGVDARVLDHMQSAREQALRDSLADELGKREQAHREKLEALKRELQMQFYPYYDPFWPSPYWRYPYYPHRRYW